MKRVVFDTNVIISRFLIPNSIPAQALDHALMNNAVLSSRETLLELSDVLSRPKFNRYVSLEDRQNFLKKLTLVLELVDILKTVKACRDPKDDKFLELAINGRADFIVTGDQDLLDLNPFYDTRIVTPADYLLV